MRKRFNIYIAVVLGLLLLVIVTANGSNTSALQTTAQPTGVATAAGTEVANPCVNPAATAAPTMAATAAPATLAAGATQEAAPQIARPSNPGGPGPAVKLIGDVTKGQQIFVDKCQKCHGDQGTTGVANPGSDDGTVPVLNPIDPSLVSADHYVYVCNIDLFLEHGSVPSGPSPQQTMPAWGDSGQLTAQQIADVSAYVISLNPVPTAAATPAQ